MTRHEMRECIFCLMFQNDFYGTDEFEEQMSNFLANFHFPEEHEISEKDEKEVREKVERLIALMPDIDEKDIQNEKMREQEYEAVILSGDNEKIASILKLIYSRKQERAEQGKKLSSTDERYFKLAEYMLFSELSFVLNVPREHIEQYIADMIEA